MVTKKFVRVHANLCERHKGMSDPDLLTRPTGMSRYCSIVGCRMNAIYKTMMVFEVK